MRVVRLSFPLLLAAGLSAACDDTQVVITKGVLLTEELVDFGDVQVGILIPYELEVKNDGEGSFEVEKIEVGAGFSVADYEFKLSETKFALGAKQSKKLTVSFQPWQASAEPVESTFTIHTDILDGNNQKVTFTVRVRGRGVTSGIEIVPNPVDFGKVLVGSSRTLDVQVFNRLSVSVDLTTKLGNDGQPEIINQGGLGRFELVEPNADPARGGSLLPSGTQLEPNASITVKLRYIPDPSQEGREDRGDWIISNCANELCDLKVQLLGSGTNTAIECTPPNLAFGQVNPGANKTLRTTCSNVATEAVTVLGWELSGGTAPEFSVVAYSGQVTNLAPGATFELESRFSPTLASVGTQPTGFIEVRGRNPIAGRDLSRVRLPLTGEAGGPDINVLPAMVNFGQVALGTTSKKRILVENTGYNALHVSRINPDAAGTTFFNVDRQVFDVNPGESQVVEVSFAPTSAGVITSELVITSDDSDEGGLRIPLRGEGVDLPPCNYSLAPMAVNFGIVQVLRTTTQGVRLRNEGTDACLVNDIEVAAGSSATFRVLDNGEPLTGLMLAPGDTKTILVEFTPTREGAEVGTLTFYISDPANANPTVDLRGTGSNSALLITPNELDFGIVAPGCSTRTREVTIYNTGNNNTYVDRIELPSGVSPEFILEALPAGIPNPPGTGVLIRPGESVAFNVRYQAADLGADTGFFHVFERGRTDPYVIPLFGGGSKDPVNTDRFEQLETPEVDILFVIDDSCSMSEEQAGLIGNFQSFIQFADSQALDYRIAVVTTDVDACSNGNTNAQRPNGYREGQCGYFSQGSNDTGVSDPNWRLITPDEQPSADVAFTTIASQGINGSGNEAGLQAAYLALSPPVITGWNAGFVRPSAYLALIILSDEEDYSVNPVDFYINSFLAIKGFRNTHLFSASAIVGDVPGGCGSFQAEAGTRYVETAERTGGIFESICTQNWSQALQNLGLAVFGYKSRFFLSNQPVAGTVVVTVDGVPVDATSSGGQVRWVYDPGTNTVNFAPLAIPEPGSEIIVTYRAECL